MFDVAPKLAPAVQALLRDLGGYLLHSEKNAVVSGDTAHIWLCIEEAEREVRLYPDQPATLRATKAITTLRAILSVMAAGAETTKPRQIAVDSLGDWLPSRTFRALHRARSHAVAEGLDFTGFHVLDVLRQTPSGNLSTEGRMTLVEHAHRHLWGVVLALNMAGLPIFAEGLIETYQRETAQFSLDACAFERSGYGAIAQALEVIWTALGTRGDLAVYINDVSWLWNRLAHLNDDYVEDVLQDSELRVDALIRTLHDAG